MNIIIATLRGTPSARGKRVAPLKSGLFPSTNIFVVLTLGDKSPPFRVVQLPTPVRETRNDAEPIPISEITIRGIKLAGIT